VAGADEVWIPLVDEPIGGIVQQAQTDDPRIAELVDSPRKLLAFRTFAYIRVGILLGQLLLETDAADHDGTETWVDALLRDPRNRAAVAAEVRAVAEEVARDCATGDGVHEDGPVGPDDEARRRFREFARRQLG
jgi:hypothetical protein